MKFNNLSLGGKEVTSIISHSRSTPTYAEAKLKEDILLILQGKKSIDSPWINLIWDLPGPILWPEEVVLSEPIPLAVNPQYPINPSQISAIESMLSPALEDKLTIIQGPPGYATLLYLFHFRISFIFYYIGQGRLQSLPLMSCLLLLQDKGGFG